MWSWFGFYEAQRVVYQNYTPQNPIRVSSYHLCFLVLVVTSFCSCSFVFEILLHSVCYGFIFLSVSTSRNSAHPEISSAAVNSLLTPRSFLSHSDLTSFWPEWSTTFFPALVGHINTVTAEQGGDTGQLPPDSFSDPLPLYSKTNGRVQRPGSSHRFDLWIRLKDMPRWRKWKSRVSLKQGPKSQHAPVELLQWAGDQCVALLGCFQLCLYIY